MLTVTDLELKREGRLLHPSLSFTLKKGNGMWVKGPNGVGKSSLLKALLGWLPHSGIALTDNTKMAYLGHQNGLPPYLTVWQHCALHPSIPIFDPQACAQLLERLSLDKLTQAHISTLSAGQKQRLALATVMLSGAHIWLLDEPFNTLDKKSVAIVKSLFNEFLSQGVAMMVVSHDDLSNWATHTLCMEGA